MENKFDIKVYNQKMSKMRDLQQQLSASKDEIDEMINALNEYMIYQFRTLLFKVFPREDFNLSTYQERKMIKVVSRFNSKEIAYKINIVDYLVNIYRKEYSAKLNKRYKNELYFYIAYNFYENKFTAHLDHEGFYQGGFIKDELLQESSLEMVLEAQKRCRFINFSNINGFEQSMREVKEVLDNHSSYYVAQRLIK